MSETSGQIAKVNDIEIWYETFGKKSDPALLLIMGALCQGIQWPTEFCDQLANSGFYVIRYDQRDAGLSTCLDFEKNPYDLLDMAKDATLLLDYLKVQNAHICGFSMGGSIAELLSVHFPKSVATLTLISTSCDIRPLMFALMGDPPSDCTLSSPKQIYIDWMRKSLQSQLQTQEKKLEEKVLYGHIINGSLVPFDEDRYREIQKECLTRIKHPECLKNHVSAIKRSFDMIQEVPRLVRVPTLVIHGSEDPVVLPDHGQALSALITNSRFLLVNGFGHVLNNYFYDLFTQEITKLALSSSNSKNNSPVSKFLRFIISHFYRIIDIADL